MSCTQRKLDVLKAARPLSYMTPEFRAKQYPTSKWTLAAVGETWFISEAEDAREDVCRRAYQASKRSNEPKRFRCERVAGGTQVTRIA